MLKTFSNSNSTRIENPSEDQLRLMWFPSLNIVIYLQSVFNLKVVKTNNIVCVITAEKD